MLLLLPPSETKRPPPDDGPPVDLAALSFPELTPMRERLLDALVETSEGPDAFYLLHARPSKALEVARNTAIRELPTMAASDVYSGPFHQGLAIADLSPPARERAEPTAVVTSPLWGALRLGDRIPPYRLHLFSRPVGMRRLDHEWQKVLPAVLTSAAGRAGLIVELRSPESQAIGKPVGLARRTVELRVDQGVPGRRIGDVIAKRVRGQAAHHLLESGVEPSGPEELAALLGERWPVVLGDSRSRGGSATLTLFTED